MDVFSRRCQRDWSEVGQLLFATSLDALLRLETLWSGPHPTEVDYGWRGSSCMNSRGFMGFPVRFGTQTHLVLFAMPWLWGILLDTPGIVFLNLNGYYFESLLFFSGSLCIILFRADPKPFSLTSLYLSGSNQETETLRLFFKEEI